MVGVGVDVGVGRAFGAAGVADVNGFGRDFVVFEGVVTLGAFGGIAFMTRGDSSGLIVSLITSTAGFVNVTGIFRWTSRFTVAISRWASSE